MSANIKQTSILRDGHGTLCPYDMIINYKLAEYLKVCYDVYHTTEVNLREQEFYIKLNL